MRLLCPTRGFHDTIRLVVLTRTSIETPATRGLAAAVSWKRNRPLGHSNMFLNKVRVAEVVSEFHLCRFSRAPKHQVELVFIFNLLTDGSSRYVLSRVRFRGQVSSRGGLQVPWDPTFLVTKNELADVLEVGFISVVWPNMLGWLSEALRGSWLFPTHNMKSVTSCRQGFLSSFVKVSFTRDFERIISIL